jgi:hypothetical protein
MISNHLARGFDTVLMRYLPQLLCFEVKPSYTYKKADYMRLLVNSSVLNAYAEGMSNVSNKLGAGMVPNADTALLRFKSIDRYELQSVVSMVLEEQVDELKRKGLLDRPVPIAFDWHDQMFYGDHDAAEMVNGTKPKDGSCYAYQYLTASILVDGRRLTILLAPIKTREHLLDYVKDALNRIRNAGIRVRYLLFDGGFSSLELPSWLEQNGYLYAIHFAPNRATKRIGLKDGESISYPCERPFKLVRVDDDEGKTKVSYLFATNMRCRPKSTEAIQDSLGRGDDLSGAQHLPPEDEIEELHGAAPLLRGGRLPVQRVVHPEFFRARRRWKGRKRPR